ncbi:MAG: hypothetical protein O3C62_10955 [Actinomycetota bacterium]|nr:hypothetical protein [Actinomycetota bacterium]MDA2972705.1 hypothetical protein [Actinomycetota bacterium]MDA3002185.1 hypothetical protein [Actinomycetota bacterium]
MAFGQPSGPPATAAQMRELLALVVAAGHRDFRDARGPLQLTQRQAAGKFTRDEADHYIDRLVAEAESGPVTTVAQEPTVARVPRVAPRRSSDPVTTRSLDGVASEDLAAELQSRGWVVLQP